MKELPDVEMEKFERLLSEVNMSMNRREEKLKDLYDKVEAGLVLLGATAVTSPARIIVESEMIRTLLRPYLSGAEPNRALPIINAMKHDPVRKVIQELFKFHSHLQPNDKRSCS